MLAGDYRVKDLEKQIVDLNRMNVPCAAPFLTRGGRVR